LRNTPQLFTVEVRRRRGQPTAVNAKPTLAKMFAGAAHSGDGDADRSMLCETDRVGRHAVEVGATHPSGRILPSLVESSPWTIAPVEAPPRRHARGKIAKEAAGKPTPVVASLTVAREEPHGQTDVCSMTESSMAPRPLSQAPTTHASPALSSSDAETSPQAERAAVTSTASRKLPRRAGGRKKEKKDTSEAAPAPFDAEPAVPEEPSSDPPNWDDGASRRRHRSIMARYVFGTELKPGERWRQRMRRVR
jgi:hypothetical protein